MNVADIYFHVMAGNIRGAFAVSAAVALIASALSANVGTGFALGIAVLAILGFYETDWPFFHVFFFSSQSSVSRIGIVCAVLLAVSLLGRLISKLNWVPKLRGRKLVLFALAPLLAAPFIFENFDDAIVAVQPYSYKSKDCSYSVAFPSKPDLRNLSIPINGQRLDYEQAQLISASSMMRAECIPVSITEAEAKDMLTRQVASDGFQNPSITVISPKIVELRGYKMIAGEQGIFVGRIHHGPKSTLTLAVGTRSSAYPTKEITAFFDSVVEDPDVESSLRIQP